MSTTGHFMLGRGRVKEESPERLLLDCGCIIKVQAHDIKNHVWTWSLDYSDCRDHHHDGYCRPGGSGV